jgi:hypothetical protein
MVQNTEDGGCNKDKGSGGEYERFFQFIHFLHRFLMYTRYYPHHYRITRRIKIKTSSIYLKNAVAAALSAFSG